jgi:hypothetical protein
MDFEVAQMKGLYLGVGSDHRSPRAGQFRFSGAYVLAAAFMLSPWVARAQSSSVAVQNDLRQIRADAAASIGRSAGVSGDAFLDPMREGESSSDDFTFTVLGPVVFNSNADSSYGTGTSAAELTPEARLGWSKQVARYVKFSALADVNSDRYPSYSSANGDASFAKLRAQYSSGGDDQELSPYIEYSPKISFEPTFSKKQSSSQDLSIGFDKTYNFLRGFAPIDGPPRPDSSLATVWSVGFTGTVSRRFAGGAPDSWIGTASPSLSWNATQGSDPKGAQWNLSLEVDVSHKIFDATANAKERDTTIGPVLTVEFLPPLHWFEGEIENDRDKRRTHLGRPRIDFQLSFVDFSSNTPQSAFHQWTLGPTIKASWDF